MIEAPKLANSFVDFSVVFANDSKSERGVWREIVVLSGDSVICSVVCPGIGKTHYFCNLLIDNEIVSESSLRQAKKVPFLLSQIVQIPKILYLRTLFVVVDFIM